MELKQIQETLTAYSGVNLVYRCLFLCKKKNEYSLDFIKIALKECLKYGLLDLYKTISNQYAGNLSGFELTKGSEFYKNPNQNL